MRNRDETHRAHIVIIGIGNDYRCDDAAGLLVARALRGRVGEAVNVIEHQSEGTSLIDRWGPHDTVFLIDAMESGSRPGRIYHRVVSEHDLDEIPIRHSTHSISVADAIAFARAFNKLPAKIVFYGIEGHEFSSGDQISPKVREAIPRVLHQLWREIADHQKKIDEVHDHA